MKTFLMKQISKEKKFGSHPAPRNMAKDILICQFVDTIQQLFHLPGCRKAAGSLKEIRPADGSVVILAFPLLSSLLSLPSSHLL